MPSLSDLFRTPESKTAARDVLTQGPLLGGLLTLGRNPDLVKQLISSAKTAFENIGTMFAPQEAAMIGPFERAVGLYPELVASTKAGGILSKLGEKVTKALNAVRPAGAAVTPPTRTYNEGVKNSGNVWVRQAEGKGNGDRTLMVQFTHDMVTPQWQKQSAGSKYYDALYSGTRPGYDRPADFFELPQWQAKVAQSHPNTDVYVVRNLDEAKKFFNDAGYKNLAFSALDINTPIIKDIAAGYKGDIVVGGYADKKAFEGLSNVKHFSNIDEFVKSEGFKPREGYDYRHFEGTSTVPRLTMSSGCTHRCSFCAIEKDLKMASKEEIMQQADNIGKNLNAKLVYLNDKTFGQAPNYKLLPEVFERIKAKNPDFEGFVVQTTATQVAKGNLTPAFLRDAHIKNVELGIETYNDSILRQMKKPATEAIMDKAAENIRKAGSNLIPNLIVGLPGETAETYGRTMGFLNRNRDIISHPNVEYLEMYTDSPLATELKAKANRVGGEEAGELAKTAGRSFYNFGLGQLERPAYTERPLDLMRGVADFPKTVAKSPVLSDLLAPPKTPQFIGRQEGFKGVPAMDMYNDPVTGSTFTVKPGEDVEKKMMASRAKFEPKKPALKLSKLGSEVAEKYFKRGWITPEGKLIDLEGSTHNMSAAEAGDVDISDWRKVAHEHNLVRVDSGFGGNRAEFFAHPTDEQINALRSLEKNTNIGQLEFDLTQPFIGRSGAVVGGGTGVNKVRRMIEDVGYDPTPTGKLKLKPTSELLQNMQQLPLVPTLQDLLDPPQFGGLA